MSEFLSRRMARRPFWNAFAVIMVATPIITILVMHLLYLAFGFKALLLFRVIEAVAALPWAILGTRRLHDTNHSGLPVFLLIGLSLAAPYLMATSLALLLFPGAGHAPALAMKDGAELVYLSIFPLMAIMLGLSGWIIYWWCQPSDTDGNRFGPPPGRDRPPTPDDDKGGTDKPVLDFLRPVTSAGQTTPVARPIRPPTKSFGKRAH